MLRKLYPVCDKEAIRKLHPYDHNTIIMACIKCLQCHLNSKKSEKND